VHADAELNALFRRHVDVALGHAALHFRGAAHRIDDALKLNKRTIAGGLDDAPAMLGDLWTEECVAIRFEVAQRTFLVIAHQPRIAGDVRCQYRRQSALDPLPAHLAGRSRKEGCLLIYDGSRTGASVD